MRWGIEDTKVPSHAGRLRPLERYVFAVVFSLMASFVVLAAFLANTPRGHVLLTGPSVAPRAVSNGLSAQKVGLGHLSQHARTSHAVPGGRGSPSAGPNVQLNDAELATALRPVVGGDRGRLAVGAIDLTSGSSASYNSDTALRGGGLVTADILAVLLLQHQQTGTPVSAGEAELAANMMQNSDSAATTQLWTLVGGAAGLAAANSTLKLHDTAMMAVGRTNWRWTRTTVADQLQLLADLTRPRSPLNAAYRDYALGLMASAPAQHSSVLGAASGGAPAAIADGSLLGPRWVIGSIGVLQRHDHEVLVAVLSDRNPAQTPAVTAARAAAGAAADLVTPAPAGDPADQGSTASPAPSTTASAQSSAQSPAPSAAQSAAQPLPQPSTQTSAQTPAPASAQAHTSP